MNLSSKLVSLIEVYRKQNIKDLEVNLKEFHKLLDTLVYLHETLSELKIEMPHWKTYSDTLMTKFYLHSYSFHNALCGIEIKSTYLKGDGYNKRIIDIPSAKILLRAQFEAFFMYHHVYVNPTTEDEKELRFNAWLYSSMLERQSFPDDTSFAKEQKAIEKNEIEKIKRQMPLLPAFGKLTIKQQTGLLEKGSDKLFKTWDVIMKETGFDERHAFATYYSILSSYAHSEGLSILQIKQSKLGYNKGNEQGHIDLMISKQLICLMILSIKKLYRIIEIKYNMLPRELQDTIEIYAEIGRTPMRK